MLLGVTVLRERLRPAQWVALGIGASAVAVLTVDYGRLPWLALTLAFSFAGYGLVKKRLGLPAAGGALRRVGGAGAARAGLPGLADRRGDSTFGHVSAGHTALLVLAGAATAIPLLLFAGAANRLPLTGLGMLQYLAPILQLGCGVLIFHEPMPPARLAGFALVWLALVVFTADAVRHVPPHRAPGARAATAPRRRVRRSPDRRQVRGRRTRGAGVPSARCSSTLTSSASVNRVAPVKLQVVAGRGQPGADLLGRAVRAARHQPERCTPCRSPSARRTRSAWSPRCPTRCRSARSRRAPARRRPPAAWRPSTPAAPGVPGGPGRPGGRAQRRGGAHADQQRQRGGGQRGQRVPPAVRGALATPAAPRASSSSAGTRRLGRRRQDLLQPAPGRAGPSSPGRTAISATASRHGGAAGQVPLVGRPLGGGQGTQHVRAVVVRELAPGHPVTPISARTNRSDRSA